MRFRSLTRALPALAASVCVLLATGVCAAAPDEAKRGVPLVEDKFEKAPPQKGWRTLNDGWRMRRSFGSWTAKEGVLTAVNVPAEGHGPVLAYEGKIRDAIIECEYRLPEKTGERHHFRIFLDHPDYRGHTVCVWANRNTTFRPRGLSVQHISKEKDKTIIADVELGREIMGFPRGQWHKMRIELRGDSVRASVDDHVVAARHQRLDVEKYKIGLNPGGGGQLRNFKVWRISDR